MARERNAEQKKRLEMFRGIAAERIGRLNLAWIRFEEADAGAGVAPLKEFLREIHTLKGEASLMSFPQVVAVAHEIETRLRPVVTGELRPGSSLGDLVLRSLDMITALIAEGADAKVSANGGPEAARAPSPSPSPQGNGPAQAGSPSGLQESLRELLGQLGSPLSEEAPAPPPKPKSADGDGRGAAAGAAVAAAPAAPSGDKQAAPSPPSDEPSEGPSAGAERSAPSTQQVRLLDGVRVTNEKLDRLRDVVGELLLTRARLEMSAAEFRKVRETTAEYRDRVAGSSPQATRMFGTLLETITGVETRIREDGHRVSRLVTELDGATRELRMVPIRSLYEQYPRAVRSLARAIGREVRLECHGETIEVDRAVLDRISDPLLHILRNAVDHGIESPGDRQRRGKSAEGVITIRAYLEGSSLHIKIQDDGAGVDVTALRHRVVELGLVDAVAASTMSDRQLIRTLFMAGMSTRRQATELSGRGIGLHVVLTDVESIGGTVDIESVAGMGTTFHIIVPVTIALTSIVVFRVDGGRYALPASSIIRIVSATACERLESVDGPCIRYEGSAIPLIQLDRILGESTEAARVDESEARVMLVHDGRTVLALAGSSDHAEHEVILKPMSRFFEQRRLIASAVPMADGTLALVLTVGELLHLQSGAGLGVGGGVGSKGSATARRRRTVLVVDDSPVIRDLISEALRSHGLRVLEAGDGEEAMGLVSTHEELQLVITDLDMPKLDGVGLIKQIRARPGPRLPVLVVTMRGSDEEKRATIEAGADAYLVKNDLSHGGLWRIVGRMLG